MIKLYHDVSGVMHEKDHTKHAKGGLYINFFLLEFFLEFFVNAIFLYDKKG